MPFQSYISFLSGSRIMDFDASFLTMRAGDLGRCCHHLYPDRAVCEPFLAHTMQLIEISWHQNGFAVHSLFCDMLSWQGLSSVTRLFFEPSSNEGHSLCFFLFSSLYFVSPARMENPPSSLLDMLLRRCYASI